LALILPDESSGGVPVKMVFERHIVYPNGHREVEGVTPKQLPPPNDYSLTKADGAGKDQW
jgi:hypothetical protein